MLKYPLSKITVRVILITTSKNQLLHLKLHFEKSPNNPTLRFLNTNSTFLSEVVKLVVLVLVAPATTAISERLFSTL